MTPRHRTDKVLGAETMMRLNRNCGLRPQNKDEYLCFGPVEVEPFAE